MHVAYAFDSIKYEAVYMVIKHDPFPRISGKVCLHIHHTPGT